MKDLCAWDTCFLQARGLGDWSGEVVHCSSFKVSAFCVSLLVVMTDASHAENALEIAVVSQACPAGHAMMFSNQAQKVPLLVDRTPKRELAYWNEVKQTGDASQLLVYISNFPDGMFVEAAVALYKLKCGDLTELPVKVLSCAALPPPPPKKVVFIPPPKRIIHLPPPKPKPKIDPDPIDTLGHGHGGDNNGVPVKGVGTGNFGP